MNLNRISIIGISASGKSVFSRKLAQETHLPLFHMDQIFWKGNWQEIPEKDYLLAHQELIQKDNWIIDGYVDEKMADRLQRSDLVIFLDYPGWLCAWRLIKRWLKHSKQSRPELPKESLENFDKDFFWTILTRKERIPIEHALNNIDPAKLLTAHSPRGLKRMTKKFLV